MFFLQQAPFPELKIYKYNSKAKTVEWLLTLSNRKEAENHSCLLSYSFSEDIDDLTGQFNFSIAGGNNTVFDKIEPLNIVEIYEGNKQPLFVGVISTKSLSCSMGNSGIRRNIQFSGKSITSLIADFQLILDSRFLANNIRTKDAKRVNNDITLELNKMGAGGLSIQEFLEKTWSLYLEYTGINKPAQDGGPAQGKAGLSNITVYNIITHFMGTSFFEVGKAETIPMPIANTFFNQSVNTVLQIWRCILAPPVYEIFSRVNVNGKPRVVVRETPFDSSAWLGLPIKTIDIGLLTDYTLHLSNNEIYTVYLAYLEGSQLNPDQYIIIDAEDASKQGESIMALDQDKFNKYGLKMCQVNFRGYTIIDKEKDNSVARTMSKYSKRLKKWFSPLDKMYMGSITIINNFSEKDKIRCGERVKFLGGEFYVKRVEHRWNYGDSPTISLQITRGGVYKNGVFSSALKNLGVTGVELKKEI